MEDIDIRDVTGLGMVLTGTFAFFFAIALFLFSRRNAIIDGAYGLGMELLNAMLRVIQTALLWPDGTVMVLLIGGPIIFIIGLFVIPHPE